MSRKSTGSLSCLSIIEIFHIHLKTIHGGVNITMTNIWKITGYWIPALRQLTKNVISKCHGCKRFKSRLFTTPVPEYLPKTCTEQNLPFEVIGIDYAGQVYCKNKSKKKRRYMYCCLHPAFPKLFTFKY